MSTSVARRTASQDIVVELLIAPEAR